MFRTAIRSYMVETFVTMKFQARFCCNLAFCLQRYFTGILLDLEKFLQMVHCTLNSLLFKLRFDQIESEIVMRLGGG